MRPRIEFEEKTGCIPGTAGQILTGLLGARILCPHQDRRALWRLPRGLADQLFQKHHCVVEGIPSWRALNQLLLKASLASWLIQKKIRTK